MARFSLGMSSGQDGRAGDEVGEFVHVRNQGLDRAEDLRLACQELPETLLDESFEVAGRHAPAARRAAPTAPDQPSRDVVAVARPLLVGVGRRHAGALVVEEHAGQ